MGKEVIRIGNAGGYWGDDPEALKRQVEGGPLDYISMDFLAEITMSILQKQRSRDPSLGYAKDFIPMLAQVMEPVLKQGVRIITNAGGINPGACATAICDLAAQVGIKPKIAVVAGDDILNDLTDLQHKGAAFANMENGQPFESVQEHILSANVYLGASGVVAALQRDPQLVITGRVTDTGITIAPMIHEFGWALDDWDKLAAGIVAGHILECGSQATGGNFTDWHKVGSFTNMGFPIVEMHADGSFVITKHPNTGGLVSVDTVREQLFYEMGQPNAYITPDVVADFTTIRLEQEGEDRVRVSGVKGHAPTPFYKVSMTYADGYKAQGSIVISGPDARRKAEAFGEIFWQRCGHLFPEISTEYFGLNACHRSLVGKEEANEIFLRLGARSHDPKKLMVFGKTIPGVILAGPPGVTYTGGVSRPQSIISYWPALLPKELVAPKVSVVEGGQVIEECTVTETAHGQFDAEEAKQRCAAQLVQQISTPINQVMESQDQPGALPLSSIALARSGDKGDMANIGIMARSPKAYRFLGEFLTAQRMKDYFQELCFGEVSRFSLDNLQGYNFLLDRSLDGGGTKSLRVDAQGKTFAQAVLAQRTLIPKDVVEEAQKS